MARIFDKNNDKRIPHLIDKIRDTIKGTRFEDKVYVVGGAVRDAIIGEEVKDLDLTVEIDNGGASLAAFLAVKDNSFDAAKNPVVFEEFGTAKLRLLNDEELKDLKVECAYTRKEKYDTSSRKPKVSFATLEEDARRRDFTVNALYYNISKDEVIDVLGTSMDDLDNGIIRALGDADKSFNDDPLRMMRAIRFATNYGWDIEKDTWMAMLKNHDRITSVSQELVTDELSKILLCEFPSVGLEKMRYCGLMEDILNDVFDEREVKESYSKNVSFLDHTLKVVDSVSPILENRLAALFHDAYASVNEYASHNASEFSADVALFDLKELKYPNKVIESVCNAIKYHDYFCDLKSTEVPSDKRIRKFMDTVGEDMPITLDLMHANNVCTSIAPKPKQVPRILDRMEKMVEYEQNASIKPPINGTDIMKEFDLKPSVIVGKLMEAVKEAYIENPKMTREECLEVAEAKLNYIFEEGLL